MKKRKILSLLPAICMMIIIFCFSAQPSEQSNHLSTSVVYRLLNIVDRTGIYDLSHKEMLQLTEKFQHPVRKAAHMSEYALLAILVSIPFYTWKRKGWECVVYGELVCFFYAATDEFHQLFVPGRGGQFTDVLIDSTGALVGIGISYAAVKIITKKRKHRGISKKN